MASTTINAYASATITLAAGQAIQTYGVQPYFVYSIPTFANYPTPIPAVVYNGSGLNTTSTYANGTTILLQAGGAPVTYNVGTGPVIFERSNYQPTPGTLNATGTLTAALMLGGIVTSTTAAAVTATTDTAALIDAAATLAVNDAFEFVAVNTGGTNAFTVAGGTSVTLVGSGAVAANTSGKFRVVKTAATPTYSVYRVA